MFTRLKAHILRWLCGRPLGKIGNKTSLESFIFLRYDRIGDLVVSLPLIKAIKQSFPQAAVALLASETNAPLASETKLFSTVYIKSRWTLVWCFQLLRLRKRFHVVVDLNHSVAPHAIFTTLLLSPRHVASPHKEGRWGVTGSELGLFDIMPKYGNLNRPMMEIYLDIARELDCSLENCVPYPINRMQTPKRRERLVLLNHEGSGIHKRISNDDLINICRIAHRVNPKIQVVMTPMRRSYHEIFDLLNQEPNVTVLSPQDSIIPTVSIAQTADLIITPDTSLVHIACAFSRPLIAIYAKNTEFFTHWRPINAAETHIIFSAHPKTLEGYSSRKLANYAERMIKVIQ